MIYQSADYRLTDIVTGESRDFEAQKSFFVTAFAWSATVAFSGVGRTKYLDVTSWLSETVAPLGGNDPFDRLIELLLTANEWLAPLSPDRRHHSFSIGAFEGITPRFVLISNFESLARPPASDATPAGPSLLVEEYVPDESRSYVSGSGRINVTRQQRRLLARMVAKDPRPPTVVYEALAELNSLVADHNCTVSPGCYTSHIRRTGEGGGASHGVGGRLGLMPSNVPLGVRQAIDRLLAEQFPQGARVTGFSSMRFEASEEFHQAQLEEKPGDPSTHNNYGVFLKDVRHDSAGAKREYRIALNLDPDHVNALGNLANVMREEGQVKEAEDLYQKALSLEPSRSSIRANYADFLSTVKLNIDEAEQQIALGLDQDSKDRRLLLKGIEVAFRRGDLPIAIARARSARENHAGHPDVELYYAFALHIDGASIKECIEAYRLALALNSGNPSALLNLSQLLFAIGADSEANQLLNRASAGNLDPGAQLEAEFYRYAHSRAPKQDVLKSIERLIAGGAETHWNFEPNIAHVAETDAELATDLRQLAEVMAGRRSFESYAADG